MAKREETILKFKILPFKRGQGGMEYLLMLSVIIALSAIIAYYLLKGQSSIGYYTSAAIKTGASSASKVGLSPWNNLF